MLLKTKDERDIGNENTQNGVYWCLKAAPKIHHV